MSEINSVALNATLKSLSFKPGQITKALSLLITEKSTVPFVARYRKEATGGLEDIELFKILETYNDCVQFEDRKSFVLETLKKQELLTDDLQKKILATTSLNQLEDLYAPYKSKQKTKAQKAIDLGLEPLAELLKVSSLSPSELEAKYLKDFVNEKNKLKSFEDALVGASDIIIEQISNHTELKDHFRHQLWGEGSLKSEKRKNAEDIQGYLKYKDYFEFEQPIATLKLAKNNFRYLALRRGVLEKILSLSVVVDKEKSAQYIQRKLFPNITELGSQELVLKCITRSFNIYIHSRLGLEVKAELKKLSDESAIEIFGENLKNLLLQPYLGQKAVLGIDPGVRTGCKLAAIDKNGNYLIDSVIYPFAPKNDIQGAIKTVSEIIKTLGIEYIAIGSGTFGKETLKLLQEGIPDIKTGKIKAVLVNEDGASIYSASAIAREEFPEKDITVRGAISIARRFQDPLSELVKIDPKSIGVGQYQHDVSPIKLKKSLGFVVESCVNHVGVDINTASAPLLCFVSGIGPTLAKNVIKFREKSGGFKSRKDILDVPRFTAKTFEQSAGFLRIYGGRNPLDATFIHPEKYSLLEGWCKENKVSVKDLPENKELILKLKKDASFKEKVGEFTHEDIVKSLGSPSQDPRTEFTPFSYRTDIEGIADLKPGQYYPGIVTNMTQFGAFVDIGIKENGLIHVSQMSDTFVEDPLKVLKVGQQVKARVLEVDVNRKRIGLSLKSETSAAVVRNKTQSNERSKEKNARRDHSRRTPEFKKKTDESNPFSVLKNLKV